MISAVDRAGERVAARCRTWPVLDSAMYHVSQTANHSMLWHGINAIDAVGTGGRNARSALRRSAIQCVEQAVVNGPVKLLFRRTRPDVIRQHTHDLRTPVTSSFPSGHATAAFCAATLLAEEFGAPVLWYSLATIVAWSRVHVGVHHTSDVIGGAVVGVGSARLATKVWPPPTG